MESICRHCRRKIWFGTIYKNRWHHASGSTYCQDRNGFTASPIREAEPVLETGVL